MNSAPIRTVRLEHRDSFLFEFAARIVEQTSFENRPSLLLTESAFYPEGGGQLGDLGEIRLENGQALQVVDTQMDDHGLVHHLLAEPAFKACDGESLEGSRVVGVIDVIRRRDHMSQHTGQHVLSAALMKLLQAETVSSRLGREVSTIDVDLPHVADSAVQELEDLVNTLVLDDRSVTATFPSDTELAALVREKKLRRAPKVTEHVRLITVDGFDISPCGGTHVTATGQIGPIRITGREKYKGGVRVTFVAGQRALALGRRDATLIAQLADQLKERADLLAAVQKLQRDHQAALDAGGSLRAELASLLVRELHARHEPGVLTVIVAERQREDLKSLRSLASGLAARPDVLAVVSTVEGTQRIVAIERGADVPLDMGSLWKSRLAPLGGRGGGRADRAEGRLPADVDLSEFWRNL